MTVHGAMPEYSLAYQIKGLRSESDGWRETNGHFFRDWAGIVKVGLGADDSLMLAASRHQLKEWDEPYPRFEFDFPSDPEDYAEIHRARIELGYHHDLGPGSDLLLFASRFDVEGEKALHSWWSVVGRDFTVENYHDIEFQRPYTQVQAQWINVTDDHQWLVGASQFWMDNDQRSLKSDYKQIEGEVSFLWDEYLEYFLKKRNSSLYVQDMWKIDERLFLEGGVYFDRLDNSDAGTGLDWTIEKVNPRVGVIWKPTAGDTFRLAAFSYLLPLISSRLDPSDVAGVALYRNALEGTVTEELDVVWEREWESGFFSANAFQIKREFVRKQQRLDGMDPVFNIDNSHTIGLDVNLNQLLPWQSSGFAAGYRFLDVQDDARPEIDRREHSINLAINYVHPSGLFGKFEQVWRAIDSVQAERPNEEILVTNVKVGYHLPHKRGTLSLQVRNLFDQQFNWVTDPFTIRGMPPAREISASLSLTF